MTGVIAIKDLCSELSDAAGPQDQCIAPLLSVVAVGAWVVKSTISFKWAKYTPSHAALVRANASAPLGIDLESGGNHGVSRSGMSRLFGLSAGSEGVSWLAAKSLAFCSWPWTDLASRVSMVDATQCASRHAPYGAQGSAEKAKG
jgi:hypothetical protein